MSESMSAPESRVERFREKDEAQLEVWVRTGLSAGWFASDLQGAGHLAFDVLLAGWHKVAEDLAELRATYDFDVHVPIAELREELHAAVAALRAIADPESWTDYVWGKCPSAEEVARQALDRLRDVGLYAAAPPSPEQEQQP